jgi:hypothetical protein
MGKGIGRNDGSVADLSEPGTVRARLSGFHIDSAGLLSKHRSWLDNHVVPVLAAGGSLTVFGFASRTGSDAHNLALSGRRAEAVLKYLRNNVRAPFPFRIPRPFGVSTVAGLGESSAKADGHKDGTEDPFYRAVIVSAWHKPTPPPPDPKPKPVPAKVIRRVTSRKWSKFQSRMHGEPGEIGMELAEVVSDFITGNTTGGSDTRTYDYKPERDVITTVIDSFTVDNEMGFGVSTTTYKWEVEYHWGPDTVFPGEVYLWKRTKQIETGRDYGWKHVEQRTYPLSEIWKHTVAPDKGVSW